MKKIIVVLVLLLSIITAVGCTTKKINNDFQEILDKNNYIIVDVRTKEEYDVSHVKDSINIPYDTIDENTKLDKSKTIVVYCRSGNRSSKAYNTLKTLGYDVYDLGAFDAITLEKE
jgi:rhodanese-related sulfurtransferase